jgi:hypothetical protein
MLWLALMFDWMEETTTCPVRHPWHSLGAVLGGVKHYCSNRPTMMQNDVRHEDQQQAESGGVEG